MRFTSEEKLEAEHQFRQFLRDNDLALKSALARMEMAARAMSGDTPPEELHHAMHTLKAALRFHRGGWDAKETQRVCDIIEKAAEGTDAQRRREICGNGFAILVGWVSFLH